MYSEQAFHRAASVPVAFPRPEAKMVSVEVGSLESSFGGHWDSGDGITGSTSGSGLRRVRILARAVRAKRRFDSGSPFGTGTSTIETALMTLTPGRRTRTLL